MEFVVRRGTGQVLLLTAVLGNRLVVPVKVLSLYWYLVLVYRERCFIALLFEFIPSQLNTKINNKDDNSQY